MAHGFNSTESSLAVGFDATVDAGLAGVAIGPDALASGNLATAIGADSEAADDSVAVGDHAHAIGPGSVAVGSGAGASASDAVAVGTGVGIGSDSPRAIAIGHVADAKEDGIAIGAGVAAGPNETVIGKPGSIARFGGDFVLPTVDIPPTAPPADPTKAVIRFCSGNGAIYVWAGSSWSIIG